MGWFIWGMLSLMIWAVGIGLVVAGVKALKDWLLGRGKPKDTFGSAAWMTAAELKTTGLLGPHNGIVLGRVQSQLITFGGEGHVLLCAPSRGGGIHGTFGGKGTTVVQPTALSWEGDLLVIDPKGENATIAGAYRHRCGNLVRSFDPMSEQSDASINLIDTIRLDAHALSDATTIARGFIPQPSAEHPESAYYAGEGMDILAAVLLYIAELGPERTMGGARAFMRGTDPLSKRLDRLQQSTHPAVQETVQQLRDLKDDARKLWNSAARALNLWRDPLICTHTATSTVDLGDFQMSDAPTTLFLRSPENGLEYLAPLMRTICQIVLGRCMERTMDRNRRQLLFLLDEFSSMGPCLPIVNSLPRMSGYGLRCCLVCQDLSDIVRLYGRFNNVIQNCACRAFMTPNDLDTARYVAALLGTQTVETEAESHSSGRSGLRANASDGTALREAGRSLMTVDEVLRLPESKLLVFLSGQRPLIADKLAFDDPAYVSMRGD